MEPNINDNEVSGRTSRSAIRMSTRIRNNSPSRNYSPSTKSSIRSSRRSPARSPARSPSRRSPARSPARSKSPARLLAKSPARSPVRSPVRSPARSLAKSFTKSPTTSPKTNKRKLPFPTTKYATVSIPRIEFPTEKINNEENVIVKNNSMVNDNPTETIPLFYRLREIEGVSRRSMRISNTPKPESPQKLTAFTKNFDRAVSLPVDRTTLLNNITDGKERGLSVQRDQDLTKSVEFEEKLQSELITLEKRKKNINLVEKPQEWGGWFGICILLFVMPLTVIVPQLLCSETTCKLAYPEIPTDIQFYINAYSFFGYMSFLLLLIIFSSIPIGRSIDGQQSKVGRLQYRMNGFLCAALSLIILNFCVYKGFKLHEFILENSLQLSVSGWILGTILAILLYIKANKAPVARLNIFASTNSIIYNFWQGREINPRIGSLDIKIILLRASVIGLIIINNAVIIKALENSSSSELKDINLAQLLVSSLQIFYGIDMLIFESSILTSFEIMYEGTGYMLCVGHLLYPFLPTILSKYMLFKRTQINYLFVIPILTFIIGYIIYRMSNSQKNEFRKNPYSSALDNLETIPTSRGKKLIASGFWGYVRHPNYLGDIIMQWSVSCLSMSSELLPYYVPLCCTIILMHRAMRDNKRCKLRYDYAWEQYCLRVKYMILNYIF